MFFCTIIVIISGGIFNAFVPSNSNQCCVLKCVKIFTGRIEPTVHIKHEASQRIRVGFIDRLAMFSICNLISV